MDLAVASIVVALIGTTASWAAVYVSIRIFRRDNIKETIQSAVRLSVLELRQDILKNMAETYQTIPFCLTSMKRQEQHLDDLDSKLRTTTAYTHQWKHKIINVLTGLIAAVQIALPHGHQLNGIIADAVQSLREK